MVRRLQATNLIYGMPTILRPAKQKETYIGFNLKNSIFIIILHTLRIYFNLRNRYITSSCINHNHLTK